MDTAQGLRDDVFPQNKNIGQKSLETWKWIWDYMIEQWNDNNNVTEYLWSGTPVKSTSSFKLESGCH
jgi:hypothetical protein